MTPEELTKIRTTHKPTEELNLNNLLVDLERFNAPEWMFERIRFLMSEREANLKFDPELERLKTAEYEAYLAVAPIYDGLETYGKAVDAVRSHEMMTPKAQPNKKRWFPWSE
jgi:hypothetical protein